MVSVALNACRDMPLSNLKLWECLCRLVLGLTLCCLMDALWMDFNPTSFRECRRKLWCFSGCWLASTLESAVCLMFCNLTRWSTWALPLASVLKALFERWGGRPLPERTEDRIAADELESRKAWLTPSFPNGFSPYLMLI